jgi:hypothetical protein
VLLSGRVTPRLRVSLDVRDANSVSVAYEVTPDARDAGAAVRLGRHPSERS